LGYRQVFAELRAQSRFLIAADGWTEEMRDRRTEEKPPEFEGAGKFGQPKWFHEEAAFCEGVCGGLDRGAGF